MKKKLAVGVLSAVLLVGGATAVFGADAVDSAKLDEIKNLTKQMFGIQQQIVDKELEAGLITQEQADAAKNAIENRQQQSETDLANGKAPMFGKGKHGGMKLFDNGQPLTDEQIAAWVEQAQARITAQEEAMRSAGKLTEEQIKTWVDAAQAQLKVQEEAMKNGTFVPGGMGMFGKGHGAKEFYGTHGAINQSQDISSTNS